MICRAGISADFDKYDKNEYKELKVKNRFFSLKMINLLLILTMLAVYQSVAYGRAADEAAALEEANAAASKQAAETGAAQVYKDGTYNGSAQGYGGTIDVEVVIQDDIIKEINVLSHSGEGAAYWDMASAMILEMVQAQTPNVDTVAGATFSSNGIHNAVTEALKSALAE